LAEVLGLGWMPILPMGGIDGDYPKVVITLIFAMVKKK
jgi:hypothetical protein